MIFSRITQSNLYLTTIQPWYEASFPLDERRSFDELTSLLSYPDMHLCVLISESQLVGFIIYWQWDDLVFVEHLAIAPEQRGKQFGQQAMAHLFQLNSPYVVLEVERPTDEISRRRVRFYERQGFVLNAFDYVQPPYQPDKLPVPMRLMSVPALTDQAAFDRLSALIKERVYERFYRPSM
jgi:ribosomal protein S18 acetylase RimI-like enzyme